MERSFGGDSKFLSPVEDLNWWKFCDHRSSMIEPLKFIIFWTILPVFPTQNG